MLKLAKLPDRTPIKISITVNAVLNQDLQRYAVLYRDSYGEEASVVELIPFMLDAFLKSDPAFAKVRRERSPITGGDKSATAAHTSKTSKPASAVPNPQTTLQLTPQPKEI
jgi:hypothetical protein